jgi:hypothetical protein
MLNGVGFTVETISLLSTVGYTPEGLHVMLPNALILNGTLINTGQSRQSRIKVPCCFAGIRSCFFHCYGTVLLWLESFFHTAVAPCCWLESALAFSTMPWRRVVGWSALASSTICGTVVLLARIRSCFFHESVESDWKWVLLPVHPLLLLSSFLVTSQVLFRVHIAEPELVREIVVKLGNEMKRYCDERRETFVRKSFSCWCDNW